MRIRRRMAHKQTDEEMSTRIEMEMFLSISHVVLGHSWFCCCWFMLVPYEHLLTSDTRVESFDVRSHARFTIVWDNVRLTKAWAGFFGNSIYFPIVCHLLCLRFELHLKFCNRCLNFYVLLRSPCFQSNHSAINALSNERTRNNETHSADRGTGKKLLL